MVRTSCELHSAVKNDLNGQNFILLCSEVEERSTQRQKVQGVECEGSPTFTQQKVLWFRHHKQVHLAEISLALQARRTVQGHVFSKTTESRPCLIRN